MRFNRIISFRLGHSNLNKQNDKLQLSRNIVQDKCRYNEFTSYRNLSYSKYSFTCKTKTKKAATIKRIQPVTPLYKKVEECEVSNYRPIPLISHISKKFEKFPLTKADLVSVFL